MNDSFVFTKKKPVGRIAEGFFVGDDFT